MLPTGGTHLALGQTGANVWLHVGCLLALCGALYLPFLGATPLFDKGEPREALAVQDIVRRGEWLFPLKRATAIPSKPPLFHWSAALTYQVTGKLNEATIRFPSAFYATLGVLLLYLFGRKLFGAEVALLAGAILATTLVYLNQALNARVDMTLCFFVTASLILFYSLCRGWLIHPLWYFVLYGLVGLGTLAKGPLGLVLPGLVAVAFLVATKRWGLLWKFAFHPGVLITLVLVAGWYGLAITRGGEGFVNRQLLSENLSRFFGGSGHSHPFYYYVSYLFSLALPWSLLLPFMLWDVFRQDWRGDDDRLFVKLWFAVMFVFFSLSAGKRSVYLLPLYPALALLLAHWCHRQTVAGAIRNLLFRAVALVAVLTGALLLLIAFGDLWSHDPGWFLAPIEKILKPKDLANLLTIKQQLASFGWPFDAITLVWAGLWFALAHFLWHLRILTAARTMVLVSLLLAWVSRGWIEPEIAKTKSYREFMAAVNQIVRADEKLILFGPFNGEPVVFYRVGAIDLDARANAKLVPGSGYVITTEQEWQTLRQNQPEVAPPLLQSYGRGPEGDAALVLLRADIF